jgi:Serine/threonine protein kinase
MVNRDFERVENVFHAALDLPAEERGAYLAKACAGNDSLYAEVCSLVSALDASDGFIEEPALNLGLSVLSESESMTGKVIGSYKVLSRLGKGGMGEVYLAEDTKLGRKVALKFLSQELVNDNWAKRQLIKEAQAVAQLDHPNICSVYEIEEQEGYHFIVMQYVEGQTLSQLIRSKSLEQFDLLNLAQQIVGAIAEAHAHGIIHRDIKPGNIMVTTTGQVKVLDFGLAKIIQQKQNFETGADSISNLSQLGLLQGTVAYMSPEQLRGEKLDYRTDVFSIGTVLYEMICGSNPHSHGTHAEIISSILGQKPVSLNRRANRVSHQLDITVLKCLEKNREARYQSASELLLKLQSIDSKPPGRLQLSRFFNAHSLLLFAIAAFVAVILVFVYSQWTRPKRMAVLPLKNETGDSSLEYLADGFTDGLNNRLSGLSGLQVKPPSMVLGYKNRSVDVLQVGRDLGVDGILVGTISGAKDLPVLQVKLVSTSDGSEMWQSQYSVDLGKIFYIEGDVAKNILARLKSSYAEDENRISKSRDPENPKAREEYWLGLYYWRIRDTNENLSTAIDHFKAAIKLAPNYARAYAGLADCYAYANSVAYGHLDTKEAMTLAERAAKDAIDLDETLAEAHTSLGTVNLKYYWNWQEAEQRFKRAIELKPDYSQAHYGYSALLTVLGRTDEAIIQGRIAKDLDPFSPAAALNYCRAIYFDQHFDEARKCYDKLVVDFPDYTAGKYARGLVYVHDGMYQQALDIFEPMYKFAPRLAGAALGYTYGQYGRSKDAERILADLQELQRQNNLSSHEIALVYLGMGKMDETIDQLQRSAEERYAAFPWLATDPLFRKLQADSRFIALTQRYGLPSPASN